MMFGPLDCRLQKEISAFSWRETAPLGLFSIIFELFGPNIEPNCAFPPPRMSMATCKPGFVVKALLAMWVFPSVAKLPCPTHSAAVWLLLISVVPAHE